jgi:hemoglobin
MTRDASQDPPVLANWAGGPEAFDMLFTKFYKHIGRHKLLASVFASMDAQHAAHVSKFVCEVLGGPKAYSSSIGSHASIIGHHLGKRLNEVQRRAWVDLLIDTADEVSLPIDPEFRASFVGYLEWGSRLALINSQDGVEPMQDDAPMPVWTWASPGGPYLA